MTTIDQVENKRKQKNKYLENAFNLGTYKNIESIMGNFLLWFLPIESHQKCNGYSQEVNKEFFIKNINDSN